VRVHDEVGHGKDQRMVIVGATVGVQTRMDVEMTAEISDGDTDRDR
jgi:hypothetical protein